MPHVLAGHANPFHRDSCDQAMRGTAEAADAHVDFDAAPAAIRSAIAAYGLTATVSNAHAALTTPEGVAYAIKDHGRPWRPSSMPCVAHACISTDWV